MLTEMRRELLGRGEAACAPLDWRPTGHAAITCRYARHGMLPASERDDSTSPVDPKV